jgi:hypothetical protein
MAAAGAPQGSPSGTEGGFRNREIGLAAGAADDHRLAVSAKTLFFIGRVLIQHKRALDEAG